MLGLRLQPSLRRYMSICKLPREPFSIYGGEETMHLLMTTYRQDIISNFGCVCDRFTVFTLFSGQISRIYTSILVNQSFHAKEQFQK